jgi:hypothetical protein
VNIKFCVKLSKTPTKTYEMLQTVYGDVALGRRSVSKWFKRFKDGHEDLQDDAKSGRPSTSRNAYTIANGREMVIRDRRLTLRMMSDELTSTRRRFVKSSMNIYGRGRSAQSSSHTVSWMSRSNGDSHYATTSSRLVKTIPVFLTAL